MQIMVRHLLGFSFIRLIRWRSACCLAGDTTTLPLEPSFRESDSEVCTVWLDFVSARLYIVLTLLIPPKEI